MTRSLAEAADFVVNSIECLGLNVRSGSRLDLMNALLRNPDGTGRYVKPDDPDFEVACEALRDITQLEFFFDQIDLSSESKELRSKVKLLVGDTVLPQDGSAQSRGRDTQAELFVFAACRKAGLYPSFKEPDIVCSVNRRDVGIAVKRIKNMQQLIKRIGEGASQVAKAESYGIVAVDVVIAMNPKNYRVIAEVPDVAFGVAWASLLREIVNKYHAKMQKAIQDRGVLAIMLHDHWIRMDSNKHWRLETMTYRIPVTEIEPSLLNCLDTFTNEYQGALSNLTRLTR